MEDEEIRAFFVHVLADLHDLVKMVTEMHAELDEFRPLLAVLKRGSAAEKAGLARAFKRAAKDGGAGVQRGAAAPAGGQAPEPAGRVLPHA